MKKSDKKRFFLIIVGLIIFIVCILIVPKKIKLNSERAGVQYIYNKEIVTDVLVEGPFLYGIVSSYPDEEIIRDEDGNIIERIERYEMEASFSLRQKMSMKVHIENSKDTLHTYIFKFADKDVRIMNGKVMK